MNELANHLWQSTLFAATVAVATVALRRNAARVRYWLWLSASIKFLVPFSLLVFIGRRVEAPAATQPLAAGAVEQISIYFSPALSLPATSPIALPYWPMMLAAAWLGGALILLLRWFRRWRIVHRAARAAREFPLEYAVPILSTPVLMEPGVFGVFRPVLLLPEGITSGLTSGQFEAILAHELCHVRRRDNLTAALHMCVETLFWFHPMVWWIGARLVAERERDCDENVLKQGARPRDYARGILNVCRTYAASPVSFVSGVTGSELKQRIREIMTQRESVPMTFVRKAALAAAGLTAIAVPLVIGVVHAQTSPPPPAYTYGVVSIRPSQPGPHSSGIDTGPQGGVQTRATTVMQLLTYAYGVRDAQVVGGPPWIRTDRFDVTFTPDRPGTTADSGASLAPNRQRMQAVLRDRFSMTLRPETRNLSTYALLVSRNGHKLVASKTPDLDPQMSVNRKQITATNATLKMLAEVLSMLLNGYVTDESGLTAQYDFKLTWTADSSVQIPGKFPPPGEPEIAADAGGVSIFDALREQLGLQLQSNKGPVPVLVIEKIERPNEN
jgi:uncharacterized protein (TIGR03435 family)